MPIYNAPERDFQFILNEFLQIEQHQEALSFDASLATPLIEEGAKFAENILFPINQEGDKIGLQYHDGQVTLPPSFVDAYKQYVEAGWPSFACEEIYGGQALPNVLNTPLIEMICSANLSFGLMPGLTHGAYSAIHLHGSEVLKRKFLPKLTSGEWSGVMCLTEPQAGTDLGLITTKAEPAEGGTYSISGGKIFISCGQHNATENIIHLVLARLPNAPEGVRGISLFIVPKILVNDDGSLGEHNAVHCDSIEEKMGIHASPTCVISYNKAEGYLVGQPHEGLKAMFTMMNEARLLVGLQGLGVAEVAFQNALDYANERLQSRGLNGAKFPQKKADPLITHPDIRRMILTMRSFTEGGRALAMLTALNIDIAHRHPDKQEQQKADDFVQLMTPIIKAYFTDKGTDMASLAMQVYGGYGYIKEYGIEQYLRDARIAQIYEGANGIQALDLVGRKLASHTGRYLRSFFHLADRFISDNKDDSTMAEFTRPLYLAVKSLQQASLWVAQKALANKEEAGGASYDYLNMFAITALGYVWAKQAKIALRKLNQTGGTHSLDGDANKIKQSKIGARERKFYESKVKTARFFMNKILPQHYSLLATITTGVKNLDI